MWREIERCDMIRKGKTGNTDMSRQTTHRRDGNTKKNRGQKHEIKQGPETQNETGTRNMK